MDHKFKAYNIIVTGKVQGVFFRASTLHRATDLHLSGWVQNQADGTVRIWVEGPSEQLQQFISWCYQGPDFATVAEVISEPSTPQGFTDFEIRH